MKLNNREMEREELYKFITHCFDKGLIDNDTATVLNYEVEKTSSLTPAVKESLTVEPMVAERLKEKFIANAREWVNWAYNGYPNIRCMTFNEFFKTVNDLFTEYVSLKPVKQPSLTDEDNRAINEWIRQAERGIDLLGTGYSDLIVFSDNKDLFIRIMTEYASKPPVEEREVGDRMGIDETVTPEEYRKARKTIRGDK